MVQLESAPARSYAGLVGDGHGQADRRPPLVLLHGLTFDRRLWQPALAELVAVDPGRRSLALDLPGHGDSSDSPSYGLATVVALVHSAVAEAGLDAPVVVGHSASASIASLYAAQYPTRGVITVEGAVRVGGFATMLRSLEPVLRSPGFGGAWSRIAARAFRLDEVSPEVRGAVEADSKPRQDVVLGYWQDLFEQSPEELEAWIITGAAAIRAAGMPYVAILGADPSAEDLDWFRSNLPEARTEVWPRSGHFPQLAHPRRFAELLARSGTWSAVARPGSTAAAAAR